MCTLYNMVLFTRPLNSVTFPPGFEGVPFGAHEQCARAQCARAQYAMKIGLEVGSVDPFYRLEILSRCVMCWRKC